MNIFTGIGLIVVIGGLIFLIFKFRLQIYEGANCIIKWIKSFKK